MDRYMGSKIVIAVFMSVVVGPALVVAQEPKSATETIPVTESDSLAWERMQLLNRLAACQQDLLTMQNAKTLAEEFAKLDRRFRDHYKLGVDQVERKGDQWIPRQTPPPPAK